MALSAETKMAILSVIQKVMKENCPPLVLKKDSKDGIEAIGNVPVPYGSSKKMVEGMYFASAIIRKDNVSFYFFPCYTHADQFAKVAPTLMKRLDGKSCFHFKKSEEAPEREFRALFKTGISLYRKKGWIQ